MKALIDKLEKNRYLSQPELITLLSNRNPEAAQYLSLRAAAVSCANFGKDIYIRGLIEISNYCQNNCYYCGIRRGNHHIERYRLSEQQVLECCQSGYEMGFRTFVLQGGEDPYYTDQRLCRLINTIKNSFPDCALTLSLGERSYTSYKAYWAAGADRYLLRHETANAEHYRQLHPPELSLTRRKQCLYDLKEIGFQVGCGLMVGTPFQTAAHLAEDLHFIRSLDPEMVGIGPFIPHHDTPFANQPGGSLELTLFMLGLVRLLLPQVFLPATTALGTIASQGRTLGIEAGANVVMPNLSPPEARKKYELYDNKLCTDGEAVEGLHLLQQDLQQIGYQIIVDRGDYKPGDKRL